MKKRQQNSTKGKSQLKVNKQTEDTGMTSKKKRALQFSLDGHLKEKRAKAGFKKGKARPAAFACFHRQKRVKKLERDQKIEATAEGGKKNAPSKIQLMTKNQTSSDKINSPKESRGGEKKRLAMESFLPKHRGAIQGNKTHMGRLPTKKTPPPKKIVKLRRKVWKKWNLACQGKTSGGQTTRRGYNPGILTPRPVRPPRRVTKG